MYRRPGRTARAKTPSAPAADLSRAAVSSLYAGGSASAQVPVVHPFMVPTVAIARQSPKDFPPWAAVEPAGCLLSGSRLELPMVFFAHATLNPVRKTGRASCGAGDAALRVIPPWRLSLQAGSQGIPMVSSWKGDSRSLGGVWIADPLDRSGDLPEIA